MANLSSRTVLQFARSCGHMRGEFDNELPLNFFLKAKNIGLIFSDLNGSFIWIVYPIFLPF